MIETKYIDITNISTQDDLYAALVRAIEPILEEEREIREKLEDEFKEYNGIYNHRSIRGFAGHASAHSWGIAIDMGASTHPLGQWKPWPEQILKAFSDAGFFWGGLFKSRRDCMHFQLCTKY